jgi:hypothetical protein
LRWPWWSWRSTCQYLLAHYDPFRSTILVFLVFVFSNFLLFRLNTAHKEHVSSFSVCWSKWLILGGFFVYLFNNCERGSKKKCSRTCSS